MLCNFSVCTNGWALFAGHYHYFNVVGTKLNQAGLFPYSMLIFSFLLHTLDTPIWMQDKSNLLKLSLNWQIDKCLIYRYIYECAKPIIVHLCHFLTCHVIFIFFKLTNLVPFCRKVMLCIPLYTACLLLVTHKSYSKLQVYCNSSRTSLIEIYSQTEKDWVKDSVFMISIISVKWKIIWYKVWR